jgi:hypothetical protein
MRHCQGKGKLRIAAKKGQTEDGEDGEWDMENGKRRV